MNGRVFLAGLLGGIVLYAWGFISWMMLPEVGLDLRPILPIPGAEPTLTALEELQLDEGVYYGAALKPGSPEDPEQAMEHIDETRAGIPFMVYRPQGMVTSMAGMVPSMLAGFLLSFLQALLAAFLLNIAAPVIRKGYGGRVLFVLWLGVFACLVVHMMYANWMHFPLGYTLGMCVDTLLGWLFAGLVLAKLIRPATAQDPGAATAL